MYNALRIIKTTINFVYIPYLDPSRFYSLSLCNEQFEAHNYIICQPSFEVTSKYEI